MRGNICIFGKQSETRLVIEDRNIYGVPCLDEALAILRAGKQESMALDALIHGRDNRAHSAPLVLRGYWRQGIEP